MRARRLTRWALGAAYAAAGVLHLAAPAPFLRITPAWVVLPDTVVALTGVAELAGAAGLLQGRSARLRRWAGIGLAAYALCVWPANVQHLLLDIGSGTGLGWGYHAPRMLLQPVLIWAALWAGEVVEWPWGRR